MGSVKSRKVKDMDRELRISRAIQAYQRETHPPIREAAESQGLSKSTLHGCLTGRQARGKAHELDQSLGAQEEKVVVKRIEGMDRRGFPLRVYMVKQMAIKVLQQREHDIYTGLHPMLGKPLSGSPSTPCFKFSTQVKKQRIMSSDPKILKHAFDVM